MNLTQIESFLDSPNPQLRMRAITELRKHEPGVVVPLLKSRIYDEKFLVRSFVATALGHKRNDESFEVLLKILDYEKDPNVIAEAANSLAKFGPQAIPHVVRIFEENSNWLIRQSIFAALEDLNDAALLLKLCMLGFQGDDITVKMAALTNLRRLKETDQSKAALDMALQASHDSNGLVRASAARTLRHLGGPAAQTALSRLHQDSDYRVIRAVLEGLI